MERVSNREVFLLVVVAGGYEDANEDEDGISEVEEAVTGTA